MFFHTSYKGKDIILNYIMMQNKVKSELLKKRCCSHVREDDCIRIKVVGIINTVAFQKARICVEKLHQHLPFKFSLPQFIEMFQTDWHEYITKMKRQIGGKLWSLTRTVAVFVNDEFIGSDVEFLHYISQSYIFNLPVGIGYYESLATEQCKWFMEKSKRKYVYFTFTIDGSMIGSFVFMLYSDLLPSTCQHFLNLCTGYDQVEKSYKDSYYVNTCVHRIVKNGWLQCGGNGFKDIENSEASASMIPDESYCVQHDRRGVLSMANNGKHCNESEFIVCLKSNPWMNYYYVAFGQLVDGARTLKTLENISTYYEQPTKQIVISHCGEYIFGDEIKLETESKIFLEHQPPMSTEGEAARFSDTAFDLYSITPWLDNIADRIDVRDTASLLMAERYLHGLYCLSTDYLPGMDMRLYAEIRPIAKEEYDTIALKLRELLLKYQPDAMTEREKLIFTSDISKIILAYIFCQRDNEFCMKHISMDTHAIIHKILEVAYEIALRAVAKSKEKALIARGCAASKLIKMFEEKQAKCIPISDACISLLEDLLIKAILYLTRFIDRQEE